ncbi:hypothetical protein CPB83DRAFT_895732 [Crepidotus variabilis]|uniref:Uncharacterized protein n=1 Tax=Crepidotus variabilis TaxID=179855 RepID=A0A9P6JNP9_9AGAR|nr:hypothetical protein CPB83DRAFT_895732 [Crepidotus variabilis]
MKLSVVAVVTAAVGLAQVSALPLRLMIVTPIGQENTAARGPVANMGAIRFGHPVPPMPMPELMMATPNAGHPHMRMGHPGRPGTHHSRPCGGMRSRLRQKAIEFSNAVRKTFGLPLIEHSPHRTSVHFIGTNDSTGTINFMNTNIIPGPNGTPIFIKNGMVVPAPPAFITGDSHREAGFIGHSHSHPHHRFHQQGLSFMGRLNYSLMNLGPWEGRAVAFVLGCGIGVLLRMIWVLFIVGYRAIKGSKPEEPAYVEVAYVDMEEDVAPPSYPVEKVTVEEAK